MGLRRVLLATIATAGMWLAMSAGVSALAVPRAPSLEVPIVDQTNTLSEAQIQALAEQIRSSREQKSYQIGILVIPTLGNDEFLERYSITVAREWGIGDKSDNGVLLLIVKDDRKLRIEVGRGLEGDLTDSRASRIIRNVIAPKFRTGDYYGGISDGVNSIQLAVSKQADPATQGGSESSAGGWTEMLAYLFFPIFLLIQWVGSMLARSKSWWAGGVIGAGIGLVVIAIAGVVFWSIFGAVMMALFGLVIDFIVSKNYKEHKARGDKPSWWAGGTGWGGGGSSWSGGGGGSFGGGGFSGGGSSGGW